MSGSRGHYAKGNKSDKERQIPYDFSYMWNLMTNKQTKPQAHRYRKQIGGCQRQGVGG